MGSAAVAAGFELHRQAGVGPTAADGGKALEGNHLQLDGELPAVQERSRRESSECRNFENEGLIV